jgi:hypothetical protein
LPHPRTARACSWHARRWWAHYRHTGTGAGAVCTRSCPGSLAGPAQAAAAAGAGSHAPHPLSVCVCGGGEQHHLRLRHLAAARPPSRADPPPCPLTPPPLLQPHLEAVL